MEIRLLFILFLFWGIGCSADIPEKDTKEYRIFVYSTSSEPFTVISSQDSCTTTTIYDNTIDVPKGEPQIVFIKGEDIICKVYSNGIICHFIEWEGYQEHKLINLIWK